MRRFRSKRGETLGETLCAVLVTGLSVALLAAMISGASRLDRKTAQTASKLYSAVSKAEDPGFADSSYPTEASGTIPVEIGEGEPINIDVHFYGHKDQAVSYRGTEPEASLP